jgi:hypothetical protein
MKDLSNYIESLLDEVLSGDKNVYLTDDGVYTIEIIKRKSEYSTLIMNILKSLDRNKTEKTVNKTMKTYFGDEVKYEISITFV